MSRSPHRRLAPALLTLAVLAGCGSHGDHAVPVAQAAEAVAVAEHPATEHPATEHPAAEHPATEHPATEHPTGHEAGREDSTAVADVLTFSARTVAGEAFEGSSVAGKKAVFWFWAPGCSDCAREAPHLVDAEKEYGATVSFVGVPGLGKPAAMKAAIAQMKVGGFTQVADVDGAIWKRFGVVAQPAYAFVDAAGKVTVVKGSLGEGIHSRVAALAGA